MSKFLAFQARKNLKIRGLSLTFPFNKFSLSSHDTHLRSHKSWLQNVPLQNEDTVHALEPSMHAHWALEHREVVIWSILELEKCSFFKMGQNFAIGTIMRVLVQHLHAKSGI